MKKSSTILVLAALSVVVTVSGCAQSETMSVEVTEVIDGDSLHADPHEIRMLGIDTPETFRPGNTAEFRGVENDSECLREWGYRAANYTQEQLEGEQVTLRFDKIADRKDRYGRTLAYIHHDNESFNEKLLEKGYARVYDSAFTEKEHYLDIEEEARQEGRGLWGCS